MAHFSEFQLRRFRMLFQQHAEDTAFEFAEQPTNGATVEGTTSNTTPFSLSASGNYANSPGGLVGAGSSGLSVSFNSAVLKQSSAQQAKVEIAGSGSLRTSSRLGPSHFHKLLTHLGPQVSLAQVQTFMLQYDSSCTGTMDFDDFLEFLADYEATLEAKRQNALEYYRKQAREIQARQKEDDEQTRLLGYSVPSNYEQTLFLEVFPSETDYLKSLSLDDPEDFFRNKDPITTELTERQIITDTNILNRKITVRVFGARNLANFLRIKCRRNKSIEYRSIDPFIRVKCGGITMETTALVGATRPEWDHDLMFDINIPPGEISDVMQWVNLQQFEISLLDYIGRGITPHAEVIGTAHIPLIRVLMATRRPQLLVLKLSTPDGIFLEAALPRLEVSVIDHTVERWAWAKVLDAFEKPEDFWSRKYGKKLREDLPKSFSFPSNSPVDTVSKLETHYFHVISMLRQLYPRRSFPTIYLDESNTYKFLPTLLRPLTTTDPRLQTPQDIAFAVSRIPYLFPTLPVSDITTKLILKGPKKANRNPDVDINSTGVAAWSIDTNPSNSCTYNAFAQVMSSQMVIMRRAASLLEKAVLLCSLLSGLGLDAYVVIGKIKYRDYVWVIALGYAESSSSRTTGNAGHTGRRMSGSFIALDRTKFKNNEDLIRSERFASSTRMTHWDPITGKTFYGSSSSTRDFFFEKAEVVFNHANLWYNVQKCDSVARPVFTWDLSNPTAWLPLLTESGKSEFGSFVHNYSTPEFLNNTDFNYQCSLSDERFLVTSLVHGIRSYRRHFLLLPDTQFHRELSRYLQTHISKFETTFTADRIASQSEHLLARRGSGVGGAISAARRGSLMRDSTNGMDNRNIIAVVDSGAVTLLPNRHGFWWTLYHFKTADVNDILEQLILSGACDISLPNAMYAIAAKTFSHPLEMMTTWVAVGYLCDLYHSSHDVHDGMY